MCSGHEREAVCRVDKVESSFDGFGDGEEGCEVEASLANVVSELFTLRSPSLACE